MPLSSSDAGSPPHSSNSTVYASADAARVGGGLYQSMLESVITLATDPAPTVAEVGVAVLRIAGVELAEATRPGTGILWSTLASCNMSPSGRLRHAHCMSWVVESTLWIQE